MSCSRSRCVIVSMMNILLNATMLSGCWLEIQRCGLQGRRSEGRRTVVVTIEYQILFDGVEDDVRVKSKAILFWTACPKRVNTTSYQKFLPLKDLFDTLFDTTLSQGSLVTFIQSRIWGSWLLDINFSVGDQLQRRKAGWSCIVPARRWAWGRSCDEAVSRLPLVPVGAITKLTAIQ